MYTRLLRRWARVNVRVERVHMSSGRKCPFSGRERQSSRRESPFSGRAPPFSRRERPFHARVQPFGGRTGRVDRSVPQGVVPYPNRHCFRGVIARHRSQLPHLLNISPSSIQSGHTNHKPHTDPFGCETTDTVKHSVRPLEAGSDNANRRH